AECRRRIHLEAVPAVCGTTSQVNAGNRQVHIVDHATNLCAYRGVQVNCLDRWTLIRAARVAIVVGGGKDAAGEYLPADDVNSVFSTLDVLLEHGRAVDDVIEVGFMIGPEA